VYADEDSLRSVKRGACVAFAKLGETLGRERMLLNLATAVERFERLESADDRSRVIRRGP